MKYRSLLLREVSEHTLTDRALRGQSSESSNIPGTWKTMSEAYKPRFQRCKVESTA